MKVWTVNNIRDSGARMMCELLKTNTTLTQVYLDGDKDEV